MNTVSHSRPDFGTVQECMFVCMLYLFVIYCGYYITWPLFPLFLISCKVHRTCLHMGKCTIHILFLLFVIVRQSSVLLSLKDEKNSRQDLYKTVDYMVLKERCQNGTTAINPAKNEWNQTNYICSCLHILLMNNISSSFLSLYNILYLKY